MGSLDGQQVVHYSLHWLMPEELLMHRQPDVMCLTKILETSTPRNPQGRSHTSQRDQVLGCLQLVQYVPHGC